MAFKTQAKICVPPPESIRSVLYGQGRLDYEAGGGLLPFNCQYRPWGAPPEQFSDRSAHIGSHVEVAAVEIIVPARAPVTIDNKAFSQVAKSVKARAAGSQSVLSTCRMSPRLPREALRWAVACLYAQAPAVRLLKLFPSRSLLRLPGLPPPIRPRTTCLLKVLRLSRARLSGLPPCRRPKASLFGRICESLDYAPPFAGAQPPALRTHTQSTVVHTTCRGTGRQARLPFRRGPSLTHARTRSGLTKIDSSKVETERNESASTTQH